MTPLQIQAEIDSGGSFEETMPDGSVVERAYPPVPIDSLQPRDDNPRRNDEAAKALAKTITEVGWGAPVLVQKHTGEVIGGHTRLKAAKILGLKRVPVRVVDVDDRRAKKMALADNRIGELAEWHWPKLAEELSSFSLDEADTLGFDSNYLEKLADKVESFGPLEGEGEKSDGSLLAVLDVSIDEPKHEVETGDVWTLDNHVLICCSVIKQHMLWSPFLHEDSLFCPFPGPFVALGTKAKEVPLVMVQPDKYTAGHIIDRYLEANPEADIKKVGS